MSWDRINRQRIKHIRFGERLFYRMYSDVRVRLLSAIDGAASPAEINAAVDSFIPRLNFKPAFEQFYVRVGLDFAQRNYREAKRAARRKKADDFEGYEDIDRLNSGWVDDMMEYVRTKCGRKISQVAWTHVEDIQRVTRAAVKTGVAKGYGALQIANLIGKTLEEKDKWKALRIARTEVVSASNQGAYKGASEAGIELEKIWLAAGFPGQAGTMREDHNDMNEHKIGIDEEFEMPDGTRMLHPGEPNAPPEHIINCRCCIAFVPKEQTDLSGL